MGPLTGQWADTLLAAEQLRLLQLLLWSVSSVVAGTAVFSLLRVRRLESPLLTQFALQGIAWGLLEMALVTWSRGHIALRDLPSAVALDRSTWLGIGIEAGVVAVGLTLITVGFQSGRRLGFIGAGLGLVLQGVALGVIDLQLAAAIVR